MKGYAIKNHVSMTSGRARLMNELSQENQWGVTAIGSVTLNNSVGGINPGTVELACRDGAKIVWLPTIDSLSESRHIENNIAHADDKTKMPFFARLRVDLGEKNMLSTPLCLLNENGELTQKALQVIEIVKDHHVMLATGHIGREETVAIAKECHKRGFKKLVITHPSFPTTSFTKEEQKELADLGGWIEHCFTTPYTGKIAWETVYEQIRYVGVDKCFVSTDLGQPAYVYPDEGMLGFAQNLMDNGFTDAEIRHMYCEVPDMLMD
ncbi:MAG: cytosolic protein [Clostridia bacterium]|nr:cytosolic protein [Clostridia bacterium]